MGSSGNVFIILLIVGVFVYLIGVIYLSKKKQFYLGMALPMISLIIALYNLIKPILIPNPYPTMKEGILMTFFGLLSVVGLIIFAGVKYQQKSRNK